jgi:predicted Kef-type K+ transport protein
MKRSKKSLLTPLKLRTIQIQQLRTVKTDQNLTSFRNLCRSLLILFLTKLMNAYIIVKIFQLKKEFVLLEHLRIADFDEFHVVEPF